MHHLLTFGEPLGRMKTNVSNKWGLSRLPNCSKDLLIATFKPLKVNYFVS